MPPRSLAEGTYQLLQSVGLYVRMAVSSVSSSRLRRVLPFRTVVSTSTGLAYAAISLVSCVQIAAFMAGDSAWVALFIGGLLAAR